MKEIKFKLFILMCAILMVVSINVLHWTTYQTGVREGKQEGKIDGEKPSGEPVAKLRSEPVKIISKAESEDAIGVAGTINMENEEIEFLDDATAEVFDLEVTGVASAEWTILTPVTQIIIMGEGDEEICVLDWSTGKLEFSGKMSSSARSFFKYFLKPYVDEYIAGLSYEEARELEWEFPAAGRTFMFRNMTWPITQTLSIREFIEWLYENDYEIVKKK